MSCNSQMWWCCSHCRAAYVIQTVKDRPETGHRSPSEDLIVGRLTVKHFDVCLTPVLCVSNCLSFVWSALDRVVHVLVWSVIVASAFTHWVGRLQWFS